MHLADDQLVNYKYRDWVAGTSNLDYFSFAQHCRLSERDTNAHYKSIIDNLMKSSDSAVVKLAQKAHKTFKKRKGKNQRTSEFLQKYNQLWSPECSNTDQQHNASQSDTSLDTPSLRKRQLEAVKDLNDVMCSTIVDHAKKMRRTMDDAAELISALPKSNSIVIGDVLDWDHCTTKHILKQTVSYKWIKEQIAFNNSSRSSVFNQYIQQVVGCSPTQYNLQVAIRTSPVSPSDYDCHAHADFRIAEKLMHHFLDLLQAPVKILHEISLERTAACSTTIFLINTLFLSCNDTLKLKWIEVSVAPSGSVKWDGVGVPVNDACQDAVPMVTEFAGGIKTHNTFQKKNNDHAKLLLHAKDMADANAKYSKIHSGKVYCVLYHGMSITLDVLVSAEDKYVRKKIMEFKLPSTEVELQGFASNLKLLLQWRDTVISNVKSLQSQ